MVGNDQQYKKYCIAGNTGHENTCSRHIWNASGQEQNNSMRSDSNLCSFEEIHVSGILKGFILLRRECITLN